MESLPNEILQDIFTLLAPLFSTPFNEALKSTATLFNIYLTSRRFHHVVEPLLYRTVVFERLLKTRKYTQDEPHRSAASISGVDVLRRQPRLGRHIQYIRSEEFSLFKMHTLPDSHERLIEFANETKSKLVGKYIQDLMDDLQVQQRKTIDELWMYRESTLQELLEMAPNVESCDLSLGRVSVSPVSWHFEVQGKREQNDRQSGLRHVRHINMRYDQESGISHYLTQSNITPILFLPGLESMTLDFRCGWEHENDSDANLFLTYGPQPALRYFKIVNPSLAKLGPMEELLRCFPNLETLALHTLLQFANNGDDYSVMGNALRAHGRNLRCFELAATYEKYELMGNRGGIGSLRDSLPELRQLRIAFPRLTGWNQHMGLRDGNRTLHIASHLPPKLRWFWTAMGNSLRDNELAEHTLALEEMFADAADGMLPELEWVLVHSAVLEKKWNCSPKGWVTDWYVHKRMRMSFYLFMKIGEGRLGDERVPPGWNYWPVKEFAKKMEDRWT